MALNVQTSKTVNFAFLAPLAPPSGFFWRNSMLDNRNDILQPFYSDLDRLSMIRKEKYVKIPLFQHVFFARPGFGPLAAEFKTT